MADWHGEYSPEEATDPGGPPSGDWRVTRGGSFGFWLSFLSVANRFPDLPGERFDDLGFRCVLDAQAADAKPPATPGSPAAAPRE